MKNMPPSALEGPMAQTQKIMLYMLPLVFAISGVNFPVGVLIYWTVTNLWSMGQQYYTIKRMPTPGSLAEKQMKERQAAKAAKRAAKNGEVIEDETPVVEQPKSGQRVQPKRKDRQKGTARPAPTRPATAQSAPQEASEPTPAKQTGSKPKPSGTTPAKQPGSKPKPSGTTPGSTPTSSGKRKQKK
jgi:YidC/Oxa1 family membrane protein insertase